MLKFRLIFIEFRNKMSAWSIRNDYSGVFKDADYEFQVMISKFKMTVYSKIMYLEKINIMEKIYANKFQLELSKKWFMTR